MLMLSREEYIMYIPGRRAKIIFAEAIRKCHLNKSSNQ